LNGDRGLIVHCAKQFCYRLLPTYSILLHLHSSLVIYTAGL
jgi:hypothetical protein